MHTLTRHSISTTCTQRSLINNAIADLNIKSNNLLAKFSLVILLHFPYYSSPTVCIFMVVRCGNTTIIQILTIFVFYGGELRLWKTPYRTHNSLVHLINNCGSIDCILEKRCVKFLWNLFNNNNNNNNNLFQTIVHMDKKK